MIAVLVGVTVYFGAKLGRILSTPPDYIATFWLPNAVILAALLLTDRRRWWIFILAMIPAYLVAAFQAERPVQIATIYFTADCTEILVAAFALTFIFGTRLKLDRLREMVMFFLLAVLTAPVVSAFIASTTIFVDPEVDYWLAWRIWFLGDAIGHLALTPVIILWVTSGLGWIKGVSFARLCEALGLVVSLLVIGYWLFFIGNRDRSFR